MHLNRLAPLPLTRLLVLMAMLAGDAPWLRVSAKNSSASAVVEDIGEHKDFKKLLRTKNNVLVMYVANAQQSAAELKIFRDAAHTIRGTGTMVLVDCGHPQRRKFCKKMKEPGEVPFTLRHYKDGDFHKNYDRQMSVSALVNFMRDPTGDLPWEEDSAGVDVQHFTSYNGFTRHLRKNRRPMLVMFYVPWCGFCKRIKPDYAKAATELKEQGYVMAAMDVERTENAAARKAYNITGFPTLLYFEQGQLRYPYQGENNKAGFISFMLDPSAAPVQKLRRGDTDWSSDINSGVLHLTAQSFPTALENTKPLLVMFYAPWCGHCKRMKPEYERAAQTIKERQIPGILAALDATREPRIAERYEVRGYPTLKYFAKGEFKWDINVRTADKLVEFMADPQEPPPPPPPEQPWEEEEPSEVVFLDEENFTSTLKRKKHVLVMFYAPWCGHCKSTKPEFIAAAESFKEDPRVVFAAVDCTRQSSLCQAQEVRGYPTIKYYSYLKIKADYGGGRNRQEFVEFMSEPDVSNNFETIAGTPASAADRDEL